MRNVQSVWHYWHPERLNHHLNTLFWRNHSSISQTDGDKQEQEQPVFNPTKWETRRAEKVFHLFGPNAVLQESGLKLENFKNLQQLPEIAVLGRTSVGKSSLINVLVHQKKLAKTSKTPGHTRLIHYFNVGSKFYLVDLPGYGYVEGQGQGSQHFVNIVEQYLKARAGKQLRSVCLLIDGKVGIKNNDLVAIEMLEEMDAQFHIAVTKMDRVSKEAHDLITKRINKEIQKLSTLCFPHVFPVSSKEKTGLSELRYFICSNTGIF